MFKLTLVQVPLLFLLFGRVAFSAQDLSGNKWKPEEMTPQNLTELDTPTGLTKEVDLLPGHRRCGEQQCTFKIYSFKGANFDPERGNILFISGGPGQIVSRKDSDLKFLENDFNVVYFDIRGSGLSKISPENKYDKFLRAEHIVEDIEKLRQELPTGKPWDAIYAHSWGTIVAQRYAKKYPSRVNKLILSAPVSRHRDSENDRRKMTLDNLEDIYRNYRSESSQCFGIMGGVVAWFRNGIANMFRRKPDPGNFFPEGTDNFCFLRDERIAEIRANLSDDLSKLEVQYGSPAFVINNFEELQKDNEFKGNYPYAQDFFIALRSLEIFGGTEAPPRRFDDNIRRRQVSAAFYLAYYLTLSKTILRDESHPLNPRHPGSMGCNPAAPLLKDLPMGWRGIFCSRIRGADLDLSNRGPESVSIRSREVLGVFDGLSRWVFGILKDQHRLDGNCFKGKDIADIASGEVRTPKVVQARAKQLGTVANEKICAWEPQKYRHAHSTLLLKGGADPVIAGGQAECFFGKGLAGERVLIEFPGVGHAMILPQLSAGATVGGDAMTGGNDLLAKLVAVYLKSSSISQFENDQEIKTLLQGLGAIVHRAAPGQETSMSCGG
jgi:pimeloyl-ACP methyl ester carboxylesterase